MANIYSIYIINKAGGLIYQYDNYKSGFETEKTFGFPLEIRLKEENDRVIVDFGERDGIRVGHMVASVNGRRVKGRRFDVVDGLEVLDYISKEENYPIAIKFVRDKPSTNEKLMLASMFHSLFAIGSQLSPEPGSSGIQVVDTPSFRLHCFQTATGVKFLALADPRSTAVDTALHKIYEIYSDFALKNPFYSLEMPIRCELFDVNVQNLLEQSAKLGTAAFL